MKLWGVKDKKYGLWANVWVSKHSAQWAIYKDENLKIVRVTLNEVCTKKNHALRNAKKEIAEHKAHRKWANADRAYQNFLDKKAKKS